MFEDDDYADHVATNSEAISEFAWNAGAIDPERAWLLHDWDVWVANPHYRGPPVPHPESDPKEEPREPANLQIELDDFIPF